MTRQSKINQADVQAIADRLRALRETTGLSQDAFAQSVGLLTSQWANFEAASVRISIDAALQLVRRMQVTLDWVYLGNSAWMPRELSHKIDSALANPTTKRGPRRKPEVAA